MYKESLWYFLTEITQCARLFNLFFYFTDITYYARISSRTHDCLRLLLCGNHLALVVVWTICHMDITVYSRSSKTFVILDYSQFCFPFVLRISPRIHDCICSLWYGYSRILKAVVFIRYPHDTERQGTHWVEDQQGWGDTHSEGWRVLYWRTENIVGKRWVVRTCDAVEDNSHHNVYCYSTWQKSPTILKRTKRKLI